jgi:hypothetical protein
MRINDDSILKELDATNKANELEKYKTSLKKAQFISEIKGGLGDKIKVNPNGIKIIKKPWHQRVKMFFIKIFTKF